MRFLHIMSFLLSVASAYAQQETLPLIHINCQECSTQFSEGTITLTENDTITFSSHILLRHRGASSLRYQKKSFAIKLTDPQGDDIDASLLGMRSDNSWILDAMAMDRSRMRNRVSMDLWNDFSAPPYTLQYDSRAVNATHGRYVEVYVNHHYEGLYCLSEKIDRKQLRLKKFSGNKVRGVLYKLTSFTKMMGGGDEWYEADNTASQWKTFEAAYPDPADGEPFDWQPLSSLIHFLTYSNTSTVNRELPERIDLPVWIDYFLFVELLVADDNVGKNQYLYCYDITSQPIISIAPWDLDATWGRDYRANAVEPQTEFINTNRIDLFLRRVYAPTCDAYEQRYQQLRTTTFHPDSLCQRFNTLYNLLSRTGALDRETKRWNGTDGITLDFPSERIYINQWINHRIAALDQKYHYMPEQRQPRADNRTLTSPIICDIVGNRINTRNAGSSQQLKQGIYIINGKKIIIK